MNDVLKSLPAADYRAIKIHTADDMEGMRRAGRLAAETLDFVTPYVVPGVRTDEIDRLCETFIRDHGAIPAPLNYRGFPKSICTSVNHVVCHGIPSERELRDGDIVNIDVTTIVDGWHGDTSRMYPVGEVTVKANRLIDVTFEAMWRAINMVKPGRSVVDIGQAIQAYVEELGFAVVEDFCGHGLGRVFHDAPNIPHFVTSRKVDPRWRRGRRGDSDDATTGPMLREGMFFTIEPMINAGRCEVKILNDGWTAVTRDRSLSAQFEHSLAVTADGYEVFTLSPAGLDRPPYRVT